MFKHLFIDSLQYRLAVLTVVSKVDRLTDTSFTGTGDL